MTSPAPRRSAFALALCGLALAGCSRDLALPTPPTRPTIGDFSPSTAFAGQLLRVTGSHFASEATGNTVNFAHASARAERWSGADLLVRVPADAGDGAITVSNLEGTSAASADPFDYLGLGEPARLQVASRSPILQRPRAVFPIAGDVVLDSALYGGLVWAGNSALTTPPVTRSAADTARGTLYEADFDPFLATPRLVAIDATTGAELASAPLPSAPEQILPLPARGVVLTFQWNGLASVEEVAGWDSTTLARVFDFAAYGIESFFGAADVGDGRVVLAGLEPAGFEFTLALLDVGASLPAAPSPAAALASPPSITIASSGLAPLAVGRASGANPLVGIVADAHLAAVALDDGNVAVADLDAPTPAFVLTVETWSPAAIESIAAAAADGPLGPRTGVAVATKPGDDLSIGFDLASGSLLWSVPGNAPGVASVDGPLAFVANSGDNDVSVVNLATGARVARVNLDVRPGAPGFAGAAAFVPSGGVDGDVLFPSTAFPGLLRFPTGTGEPVSVSRTPDNAFLSAALETRSAWSAAGGSSPFVEGWLDGSWDAPVLVGLPAGATPRITAASGHLLAVGHDAGLSLIDGAAPPVTADVAAVPGAAAPVFLALGFTPTGDVWTLVERDADVQAQLWAPTAILAGGLPTATWTVPGTPLGAALLEDGLWVFHLDAGFAPVATLLEEESLLKIGTVTPSDRLTGVHAVSPNGRLLVLRELGGALGFVLRFFRADPDAGFPEVGSLVFTERIEGFTFDATGERLFVLTQAPDRVVTVD